MYVVTKRYGRNEARVSDFRTEKEAIATIMEKLQEDKHFKLMATYRLYEGADILKEYTQDDISPSVSANNDAEVEGAAGSQMGSGQSFAPTPFNTAPHLGPRSWVKDDDKKEDDKE